MDEPHVPDPEVSCERKRAMKKAAVALSFVLLSLAALLILVGATPQPAFAANLSLANAIVWFAIAQGSGHLVQWPVLTRFAAAI